MKNMKCGMKWYGWIFAALMIAVMAYGLLPEEPRKPEPRPDDNPPAGNTNKIALSDAAKRQLLAAVCERINERLTRRLEEFESELDALLEEYHSEIQVKRANVWSIVDSGIERVTSRDGICSFGFCTKLVGSMVYDKCKGTNTAEARLATFLDPVLFKPFSEFQADCRTCNNEMGGRVLALGQRFFDDCSVIFKDCVNQADFSAFDDGVLNNVDEVMAAAVDDAKRLAEQRAWAAVFAGLEVGLAKSSVAAIRGVVTRFMAVQFGKSIARVATSATAGGTCAVADGPLPIGDMIGIGITLGGLAWTGCDIYSVTKTLPGKLRVDMRGNANGALERLAEANMAQMDQFVTEVKRTTRANVHVDPDTFKFDIDLGFLEMKL